MTTHAHDTEGAGSIDDPRATAEGDYVDGRDERGRYEAEPQRVETAADVSTATQPLEPTQRLERDHLPPTAGGDADAPVRASVPPAANPQSSEASPEPSTEESLFAAGDLDGLRSRWNDVQATFVDDPRRCVETADVLVSDVVQQLASGFSHARSKLEDQWSRGEDVSTEDLRLALKRYREFFERLLAV